MIVFYDKPDLATGFIDRFRTMLNVSGDIFAARIMQKLTGISDDDVPHVQGQEELERTLHEQNGMRIDEQTKKSEV